MESRQGQRERDHPQGHRGDMTARPLLTLPVKGLPPAARSRIDLTILRSFEQYLISDEQKSRYH
jgi:hypothetical protein